MKIKLRHSGPSVSWWHSIFTKLFLLMMITVMLIIGCYVIVNSTLLESYYMNTKENMLTKVYSSVDELCSNKRISDEERRIRLEKLSNDYNMQIILFSDSGKLQYSSLPIDAVRFQGRNSQFDTNAPDINTEAPPPRPRQPYRHERTVIAETESYSIFSGYMQALDSHIIELHGRTSNNGKLMLQISVASIKESVAITNRFLIWCGFLAMFAAMLTASLLSHRATKKIKALSEAANRMAELDFSVRCTDRGRDEIALLSRSLNKLSSKLENSVSELKKANLELTRDIDQKEKIDKQRREFLSNVSHELKTPISIIEAYAEGLTELELDEESRKYYSDAILDESRKMGTLVRKLMSLMRIENGSETLDITRYDITEQLSQIILSKQIIIQGSGARVEFLQTEPLFVWADEFLIEEVFVNFLINATKYSTGDKLIRIFAETYDNKVRICVYNRGDKVSDDDITNIWRSFYKVDKARNRENSSSGLGLSVVSAIMNAHGQQYGVYNANDGVVFWFEVDGEATE